ncbi:hypothetical protein NDU88_008075 [Pleurodeles waltl]|uniref:Uncharacterized protein n=1 Tax=Pleurodeles waltl TaxID=8319 RepID=A0AAV7NWR9_PLEWA|nr:hypothetical protein NDU88_008075 [Pleurodeles waltl]
MGTGESCAVQNRLRAPDTSAYQGYSKAASLPRGALVCLHAPGSLGERSICCRRCCRQTGPRPLSFIPGTGMVLILGWGGGSVSGFLVPGSEHGRPELTGIQRPGRVFSP